MPRPVTIVLNIILAPLVVAAAFALVKNWIATKEPPRSRKPPAAVSRVAFIAARAEDATPTIKTFGTVRSYYEAQVASQVGGEIVSVAPSFQAGEAIARTDILVSINAADYRTAVAQQEAAIASASELLAEEESRAQVAREDWLASGRALAEAPEFTLRLPQLEAARKSLASATAALEKAKLDLERTQVRAPFDAIVQERLVSPGNVVNTGTVLGTLISRDRAEVRLPLTPEQVMRLELPLSFNASNPVDLEATLSTPSQPGVSWTARLTRTEPTVDAQNQVVYIIAEIERPFDDPKAFLPIGAFVNATLTGAPIKNVYRLPEACLIEERFVWLLDADDKLQQQPVERLYSENGHLLARIAEPLADDPLRIATRPLVSFAAGHNTEPLDPNAPKEPVGKGGPGGKGKGKGKGK